MAQAGTGHALLGATADTCLIDLGPRELHAGSTNVIMSRVRHVDNMLLCDFELSRLTNLVGHDFIHRQLHSEHPWWILTSFAFHHK